ncbi:MAG: addiction module protein [Deltaproteobacteria bacterium]|nr:addiction module protein [Deltaproteobacteria bacterium]
MYSTKKLISEALHLKPAERFIVIEALIKSLDMPNPEIEAAWAEEAEKRLAAYKEGRLATISFEDMFGKKAA